MAIMTLTAASCLKSTKPGLPPGVVQVINETGFNRVVLTKTIGQYLNPADSAKLKAIYFLIANMPPHYSVDYKLVDTNGNSIHYQPNLLPENISIYAHWEKLEDSLGTLAFKAEKFHPDRDTIGYELLKETIELSFASKNYPWNKNLTEKDFYEYILPYRVGNEHLENWRSLLNAVLLPIIPDTVQNDVDLVAQCVNSYINSQVKFDKRYIKKAEIQSTSALLHTKAGNLQDISYLKIKALRSLGIPAVLEYCPYLADSNIHTFYTAAYLSAEGKFKMLENEASCSFENLKHKIPKIYRRTFLKLGKGLFAEKKTTFTTPPFLGHFHYEDVTAAYLPTETITYADPCPDSLIYLMVFSDKNWKAVDYARYKENKAVFQQAAAGINYNFACFNQASKTFVLLKQ